jgi:hypothetical protein
MRLVFNILVEKKQYLRCKEHKTQTAYHKYVDINNNRKIFILWTKQETTNQNKFVGGIWIERNNSSCVRSK